MKLYGGIDLHSNNSVLVLIDEEDRVIYEKRLKSDLTLILHELSPFRKKLAGLVVESTYNWYWLVDGLMEAGFGVHLANTAAIKQYEGLKHTDDRHDARWLAHLLRLDILPEGYIYRREARAVRDLLRRRHRLVQQRVGNLLSIQNQFARLGMSGFSAERLKRLHEGELDGLIADVNVRSAIVANLALVRCLNLQIERLEREVLAQVKLAAQFAPLLSITGIGKILALTIMLETGEIGRFAKVGQFLRALRGRTALLQREEEGFQQCQVRQPVSGLGVRGSGQFRHSLLARDQALLRAQVRPHQQDRGLQGLRAQTRAGGLSCDARSRGL
jgi:transposase